MPLLTTPTYLLSPHPDDETLGAGGLIARLQTLGTPVTVLAATDGEAAYLAVENDADPTLASRRAREQAAALHRLGVPEPCIRRLHLPDSALHTREPELLAALLAEIPAGAHLLAPWPLDFHPDHETCGRVAIEAARRLGLTLTFYLFWTWHRGTPETIDGIPFVRLPLSPPEMDARRDALSCHQSQLHHSSGQPILPENLLDPVRRPFEVFLPA